jgi:uncharacterized phage protein gp47/JayE
MPTIDKTGWTPDTQGERKADLDQGFLDEFPPQGTEFLDLTPDSYTGRSIGILAEELVTAENLVADFIDLLDPTQAEGVWVDYHLRLQATKRKAATFSSILARLEGLPGTLVGDKKVRYRPTDSLWRTPALGVDGLALVIPANGILNTTLTATVSGAVNAVETGTSSWLIVDRVTGWDTVESTARASLGSPVEADPTARARLARPETGTLGHGTKPGITKALYEIDGVTDAEINNNRGLFPSNGVPGKSIEAIVEGGDAQTIANTILAEYKGTTGYFGNTTLIATVTFVKTDGMIATITEAVSWTIPELIQIIARYTITYGRPEFAPADEGVAIALAAATAYINSAGRDVDVIPSASASAIVTALPPASEPVVVGEVAIKGGVLGGATIPISIRQRGFTNPLAQAATVTGTAVETFNMLVTWVLVLSVDNAAPISLVFAATDFAVISAARAIEVVEAIGAQAPTLIAGVDEGAIELVSRTTGAGSSIEILVSTSAGLLAELGLSVGVTAGSDGDIEVVV